MKVIGEELSQWELNLKWMQVGWNRGNSSLEGEWGTAVLLPTTFILPGSGHKDACNRHMYLMFDA